MLRLQFTDDAKLRRHVHQHLPTIGQVIGLNAEHPQAAATRVLISQSPMSPGFMAKRNAPRRMPNMRGGVADLLRLLSPDQPHAASDHFDRFFGVSSRMAKRNAPRRMPNMSGGVANLLRLLSPDQPHAASDHFDRFFGVPSRHDFHPRLRPNG